MLTKYKRIFFCNFCGTRKWKRIYILGSQNLVECTNCRLIFLDKQRMDIENLYDENYYKVKKNRYSSQYANYEYEEKVTRKKFVFAYSYILKYPKIRSLLEVGSGYGYFLKFLPEYIICSAVEVSKKAALETVKNKNSIKIYKVDFLKFKKRKRFDSIVSFDVIEHQNDVSKYLKKVLLLLKKDGVFIFTTPDYGTFWNKLFGRNAPVIQLFYHNYYFNKKWLRTNLPKLGFKIIYIRTVYLEPMNIGYILLYITRAIPFFANLPLVRLVSFLKIDQIVVPFFRFGGIECIVKKS